MSRVDLIRHPFYRIFIYAQIAIAAVVVAYNMYFDYTIVLEKWTPLVIFIVFIAIGNFFYKKFNDPFILLINESFSFAAMLSYGASYASVAIFISWLLPILFFDSKSRLEEYAHLGRLIIKLYIAGFIFNNFLSLSFVNADLSIYFASAGILAGIAMLLSDSIFWLLSTLFKKESFRIFKTEIRERAMRSPLLWAWGLIFAHLILLESYLFAILMIIPIIILYLYILQQRQLKMTIEKALDSITYMIGLRDSYTYQHSKNVEQYSHSLALALGLSEREADKIAQIAVLHDIGKVGIRDDVLLKTNELTDDEWQQMTKHPEMGANLLKLIDILDIDIEGVHFHHERWDGRGYPKGLKGEEIPLSARIISICDAWNAMRSDRPYRKAIQYDEAIRRIRENSGAQFDPDIVREAIKIFKREEPFRSSTKPKGFSGKLKV